MSTDSNLLFAVLALQSDFITREQFVDVCSLWASQKERSLGDLLEEQGMLSREDRAALEAVLARKLARHGSPQAVLASITTDAVRQSLESLGDDDLLSTLPRDTADAAGHVLLTSMVNPGEGSRYTLTRLHAAGGIGQVWVARDERLGREVALKELRPDRAKTPIVWDRFFREAMLTGQLEHPGIVPVYELGEKGESREPFYTMRFVRGRTLSEAIQSYHQQRQAGQEDRVEFQELLLALIGVCNAVAYAHSRGVLHRDLKPQNVILGDFGEAIVLDWGLARLYTRPDDPDAPTMDLSLNEPDTNQETQQGQVLGTPAYMAPEQAAGEVDMISPRTDVYGLGAILCELLTGAPPYRGHSIADVLRQVREDPPPTPRAANPEVPRPLDAICTRALAKAPADRYASAAELAEDLRNFLADEPVSAYREPLTARCRRWARQHRSLVAGFTTAALVLLVLGVALGIWRIREHDRLLAEQARHMLAVEERTSAGLNLARAGDLDQASAVLAEANGLCQDAPYLVNVLHQIEDSQQAIDNYRQFQKLSRDILREGIHNIGVGQVGRAGDDPRIRDIEEALKIYDLEQNPDWSQSFEHPAFSPEQVEDARATASQLMIFLAFRLALYDTADEQTQQNTRRALHLLDQAAREQTPTYGILMLRMLWHRRLGEDAEADRHGDRAVALAKDPLTPPNARDLYLLGSVTTHILKKPREAISTYKRALQQQPNHYGALMGLYFCYEQLRDYEKQIQPLTACLALRPDDPDLYFFRGFAHFAVQQYSDAQADFDNAIRRNPEKGSYYYFRGRTRIMQDDWPAAVADFDQALSRQDKAELARPWRAVARAKAGLHAEAAEDAEHIARTEAGQASSLFMAARAYAVAVSAAEEDDQPRLAAEYADRCVTLLEQALQSGFKDLSRVGPGSDFDPVRKHPRFQKLTDPKKPQPRSNREVAPAPRRAQERNK